MSSADTPSPRRADALARRLQASLRGDRPRPWRIILLALLASCVALAGLAWWLYPRPDPPPLQVLALDAVTAAGETPRARARLFLPPDADAPARLRGQALVFLEGRVILTPGAVPREQKVTADAGGYGEAEWPLTDGGPAEFLVRHVDARQGSMDRARLFAWPRASRVVLVDAETALPHVPTDRWRHVDPAGVAPRPGAAEALQGLRKDGWQVAYVAAASAPPVEFQTVRGWLDRHFTTPPALPAGPVFGRASVAEDSTADAVWQETGRDLRQRFTGELAAVVDRPGPAAAARALGAQVVWLGGEAAPPGARPAAAWGDVPAAVRHKE
jgi:hypothetical protein